MSFTPKRSILCFAIEALFVESEANDFDLEESLYEFAGLSATLTSEELHAALAASGDSIPMIVSWLVAASFLGLELSEGRFEYVEGEVAARRKARVAMRNSDAEGRLPRISQSIPAFRPYLRNQRRRLA